MRIIADTSRCAGAGQCVLADPSLFDQSEDDGTVIVRTPVPADAQQATRARQAVHICPSQALSIRED